MCLDNAELLAASGYIITKAHRRATAGPYTLHGVVTFEVAQHSLPGVGWATSELLEWAHRTQDEALAALLT